VPRSAVARKRSGLNQQELAKRLGKPQSFVSNVERGQRRNDILELVRIADRIGTDPTKLFPAERRRLPACLNDMSAPSTH
jgi:transcriptional regulator with XRE-family HTH domain